MTTDIKAPVFPESINEGSVAGWLKAPGETARRDEVLVEIETDKVVLEVVAPADGTLVEILVGEGETVQSEEVVGRFEAGEVGADSGAPERQEGAATPSAAEAAGSVAPADSLTADRADESAFPSASPAARKLAEEQGVDLRRLEGSGRSGRITKDDVAKAAADGGRGRPRAGVQPTVPPSLRRPALRAKTAAAARGRRPSRALPIPASVWSGACR